MSNSGTRSAFLSVESSKEQDSQNSTRRLRTRAPKSYVIPELIINDPTFMLSQTNSHQTHKTINGSASHLFSPEEHCGTTSNSFQIPKPIGRLTISRENRVQTPPPLPSCTISYLRSDNFPAWLLGDAMFKSSPNYLSQQKQTHSTQSRHSSTQHLIQTSPVRGSGSLMLGNSPSRLNTNFSQNSLSRHSSSTNLGWTRASVGRSTSPDEELERRREIFWELYEYDSNSPHLQPRYFDKPLPTNEQWSDLDIQNIGIIPEPIEGLHPIHLFEVFAPTANPNDDLIGEKAPAFNQNLDSIPFGFNFLPSDYTAHRK